MSAGGSEMANDHNTARYGETWSQTKIETYLREIEPLREKVIVSGGWAWHFLSEEGHVELKHAHDHKNMPKHIDEIPLNSKNLHPCHRLKDWRCDIHRELLADVQKL